MRTKESAEEIKKYQCIPFKVKRESWARYQLEDDTILKIKLVLVNIKTKTSLVEALKKTQETKKKLPLDMRIQMRSVMGVEVPPNLRGTPDNKTYSRRELADSVDKEDLEFKGLEQTIWVSKYELEGNVELKVQVTLIDVSRTSKYDNTGDPYYLVSSSADMKLVTPKKHRGKR